MNSRTSAQSGFTLIELLVVFAIMGGISVLVPMAFDKYRESTQYKNTVKNLMLELRNARMMAKYERREMAFQLDLERRVYGLKGGVEHVIPESLDIRATVAEIGQSSDSRLATIVFQSSGGASGGSFDVLRKNDVGTRIRVDWLTSKIELEPVVR